jgi:sec-independent protein translocase protein TatB
MFDIGFAELIIIGVVALIVIGPDRLPGAIRTGSAWLNRLRRGFNDIKQEVQQELHNDAVLRDLRESGETLRRETDSLRQQLKNPLGDPLTGATDAPQVTPQEKPPEMPDPVPEKPEGTATGNAAETPRDGS